MEVVIRKNEDLNTRSFDQKGNNRTEQLYLPSPIGRLDLRDYVDSAQQLKVKQVTKLITLLLSLLQVRGMYGVVFYLYHKIYLY